MDRAGFVLLTAVPLHLAGHVIGAPVILLHEWMGGWLCREGNQQVLREGIAGYGKWLA